MQNSVFPSPTTADADTTCVDPGEMIRHTGRLVFVDLETSGTVFARDRVIEVGLVTVDENGVEEWSTLLNPGVPLSPFITRLTGIDEEMLADAPRFSEIAGELRARLAGRLFVAHNARFDYQFLKAEFARLENEFQSPTLCTVRLSRKLFPQHHLHNLDILVERHGLLDNDRHRALADARILWQLWQIWHREMPDTLAEAIAACLPDTSLPPQLAALLRGEPPEAHGAYAFFAADGSALKAGTTANLRRQLIKILGNVNPSSSGQRLLRDTARVEWRETAGTLGARLQEIALTRAAQPVAAEWCSWHVPLPAETGNVEAGEIGEDGEKNGMDSGVGLRPRLLFAGDYDFATTVDLFGLYRNEREARHALSKLATAYGLCRAALGLEKHVPGKPCVAFRTRRLCRGVCSGKESPRTHSARLLTALSKLRLTPWPFDSAMAIVERDQFGMREDWHLIDRWRYLGSAHSPEALAARFGEERGEEKTASHELPFDPDIYQVLLKFHRDGLGGAGANSAPGPAFVPFVPFTSFPGSF